MCHEYPEFRALQKDSWECPISRKSYCVSSQTTKFETPEIISASYRRLSPAIVLGFLNNSDRVGGRLGLILKNELQLFAGNLELPIRGERA